MDLLDYMRVLRRGWAVVLAFIVVGLAAGIAITVTTTKMYEATATLYVQFSSGASSTSSSDVSNTSTFVQDQVQSLTDFANSDQVTKRVVNQLHLAMTPDDLASKISADAPLNKTLINIHATDEDATLAANITNRVVADFSVAVENASRVDPSGPPLLSVNVTHAARVPSAPVKPNKVLNIGLGFVLGLLLGVGIVILRDVLDNTVKGPSDLEALDIPILGMVPLDKRTPKMPIAFRGDPHSSRSEAYRQVRTNLAFVNVDDTPRIIAVTSAIPGEGKTTTAMNLAAALADAGSRVVLVEADLRRPTIAQVLGLSPDIGFTTVLIGQASLEDALQNAGRNLAVLTCGPVPPNPSELLVSEQARSLIRSVAEHADFVVIDTAPLLPVADGSEVAAMADATLVVHRAGKTTRDQVMRSVEALSKVGEKPVGVVLNMVSRSSGKYDYQYAYSYTYRPDRKHHAGVNGHSTPVPTAPPVTPGDPVDVAMGDLIAGGQTPAPVPDTRGSGGEPNGSGEQVEDTTRRWGRSRS
ncbi:MAG: polysaccharide biosynthesis tyrosine autokinase [Gordonia polyisoprenivorans]|nr:polysaccharide biosynthesis tyrosine autokinase [Gordonia polyisoprenivorans]